MDDFVSACLFLMENYDEPDVINIGCGYDVTIKQLADSCTARVKDLVSRSKSEPGYEISPADFPLAGISSNELKDLLANVKKGPKHS